MISIAAAASAAAAAAVVVVVVVLLLVLRVMCVSVLFVRLLLFRLICLARPFCCCWRCCVGSVLVVVAVDGVWYFLRYWHCDCDWLVLICCLLLVVFCLFVYYIAVCLLFV